MDLNQDVWDRLREKGHVFGTAYIHAEGVMVVVVDNVIMSLRDARALAHGRLTFAQIQPHPGTA